MFARIVWLVLRKDFTVEVRSLEIAYTTLFFSISCVLVFAFGFVVLTLPTGLFLGWLSKRLAVKR